MKHSSSSLDNIRVVKSGGSALSSSSSSSSSFKWIQLALMFIVLACIVPSALPGYQDRVTIYPMGIETIETQGLDGGHIHPYLKWRTECSNGFAWTAIAAYANDFRGINAIKCRNVFPEYAVFPAAPYPYYPHCEVRNITHLEEFLCFNPNTSADSRNMFITALWEDDDNFALNVLFPGKYPVGSAFKCCTTPPGYEIGYGACYIQHTHDAYGEHFDGRQFLVECRSDFVITQLGVRRYPWHNNKLFDWIQCCPVIRVPWL